MRKIIHRFFTIFAIVFVGLLLVDVATACSCLTLPLDMTIKGAKNIVILELKSVEKFKEEEWVFDKERIKQSRLVVKKVFKGDLKVGQELTFTQGVCCICVWSFTEKSIGTKFLFFLDSNAYKDGLWTGYICSRSGSLDSVSADLLYLDKLNKVKGKTRLYGEVTKKLYWETSALSNPKLAGIRVRIVGNGKDITVKTNKYGIYEVYGLPVGKYKVIPQNLTGYRIYDCEKGYFEFEIKAKSIEVQNIEYLVD